MKQLKNIVSAFVGEGNRAVNQDSYDPKGALDPNMQLPVAQYQAQESQVESICFKQPQGTAWYPSPLIGAEAIGAMMLEDTSQLVARSAQLLKSIDSDDYSKYLLEYYSAGLNRFGSKWRYADIVTVLLGLADILKPRNYLEIGVRRGRSACAVASVAPKCNMALFDKWIKNYAGMENPGPELVKSELSRVGHTGSLEFIDGNSHTTVPAYFKNNPSATFDLITVDGDHTNIGAAQDLCDVLPHLSIGGAVVFDDISHPKLVGLRQVWERVVAQDRRFSEWSFTSLGYGIGFAIRKW